MSEKAILNKILVRLSNFSRLFRNNTGRGWVGKLVDRQQTRTGLRVVLENARPLHAGLIVGSPDLVGWTSVTVTPEMVGKKLAVFTGIEVKAGTTRATLDQKNFIEQLTNAGGFGAIVRDVEKAEKTVTQWMK